METLRADASLDGKSDAAELRIDSRDEEVFGLKTMADRISLTDECALFSALRMAML